MAEKIVSVGSDYIVKKTEERFGEEEMTFIQPMHVHQEHLADKVMKEAAREMAREEALHHDGHVAKDSEAAQAQSVFAHKDDPTAPEHIVAEKVRERLAHAADLHEAGHTFVSPNPDRGKGIHEKTRHQRTLHHPQTTGYREDRNPDVLH